MRVETIDPEIGSGAKTDYRYPKAFVLAMFSIIALFIILFFTDPAGQQANIFFLKTADYMADLYNPIAYSAGLNFYYYGGVDPVPHEHAYPPLAYLILAPLSMISGPHAMATAVFAFVWFLICALFFLLLYDAFVGPKIYKLLVSLALIFSGIFICSFERGNLAILATTLCGFFCFYYRSPDRRVVTLALIALGLAVGLKGYPAILGMVLLFDRRYRDLIRLALYSIFAVFVPFLPLNGGLANIPIWIRNIGLNSASYELRDVPRFGFRYIILQVPDFSPGMSLYTALKLSDLLLALLAIGTAVFHRSQWKRITQLLLCMVLMPVNSGIYAGTYLFIGVIMFLNERHHGRRDWVYLCLMLIILNPVQLTLASGLSLNSVTANLAAYTLLILLVVTSAKNFWKWLAPSDPASRSESHQPPSGTRPQESPLPTS